MPKIYSPQQFFLSIIAAVLAAGTVGYFVGRSAVPAPLSSSQTATVGGVSKSDQSDTAINSYLDQISSTSATISDQPIGDQVVVTNANFAEGGWLAIHEDRDGSVGNIIGAQYLKQGSSASVTVDLLRPMVKGQYYARFHKDDGDHQFDLKVDSVLLDSSGSPVTLRFMAK